MNNDKAKKLLEDGKVVAELETGQRIYFTVSSNHEHSVIFSKNKGWSCSCKHSSLKKTPCSHILAAQQLLKKKKGGE